MQLSFRVLVNGAYAHISRSSFQRIDRFDRLGKALQTIHARDEDVFQPAVMHLCQNLQPELRPFVGRGPEAQNFLHPGHALAEVVAIA